MGNPLSESDSSAWSRSCGGCRGIAPTPSVDPDRKRLLARRLSGDRGPLPEVPEVLGGDRHRRHASDLGLVPGGDAGELEDGHRPELLAHGLLSLDERLVRLGAVLLAVDSLEGLVDGVSGPAVEVVRSTGD